MATFEGLQHPSLPPRVSTFHRSDFFDLVDRDDSIIGSDRSRTRGVFQPVLLEIEGKGTFVDGWMDGWMDR